MVFSAFGLMDHTDAISYLENNESTWSKLFLWIEIDYMQKDCNIKLFLANSTVSKRQQDLYCT